MSSLLMIRKTICLRKHRKETIANVDLEVVAKGS